MVDEIHSFLHTVWGVVVFDQLYEGENKRYRVTITSPCAIKTISSGSVAWCVDQKETVEPKGFNQDLGKDDRSHNHRI